MAKRRRFKIRIFKKHGGHIFYYIGRHRWRLKGGMKRNYYYRKSDGAFYSPAPRNSGGLQGLKRWWKSYRKKKYGK